MHQASALERYLQVHPFWISLHPVLILVRKEQTSGSADAGHCHTCLVHKHIPNVSPAASQWATDVSGLQVIRLHALAGMKAIIPVGWHLQT